MGAVHSRERIGFAPSERSPLTEKRPRNRARRGTMYYPNHEAEREETGILQVRLGRKLKGEFKAICEGGSSDYGKSLSMSDLIRLFAMKMVAQRRQMPEIRHATITEQIEWASRDVAFYMPVFAQQAKFGKIPHRE